jgi:3-oxoacyl-[acyl-carrier protein] reductase
MRVLVTGASQGIGAATARRLAGPDRELALHFRTHGKEAERLAEALRSTGTTAFAVGADLADDASVDGLAAELRERWRSLDGLVLNAGSYPRVAFDEMADGEFERCLRVNLSGPARLVRRLLPLLRASPSASVVFVSSVLAFAGSSHGAHYAAAKAGQIGLARSLARELAPRIRVNVVAPGAIDTAILAGDTPAVRREREGRIPLGRVGRAEEVAEAIAFLLLPSGSYTTGAVLHANGGVYLG